MLRLSGDNDQAAAGEILSLFFLSIKCCIFVIMTTLTVNIDNKKTEKAIKAVLDAFDLDYNISHPDSARRQLNRSEQIIYNRLAKSVEEIKLYKEGKIQLQDAADFLNEL
jgi:hypothetical protein